MVSAIQPINDRLLVRRVPEPTTSKLIIPGIASQPSHKGVIVALGPGKLVEGVNGGLVRRPIDLRVGDTVYFGQYNDWQSPDEDHVLIQEGDITCVVKSKALSRTP